MLWESALLSLLVSLQTLTLGSRSLDSTWRFGASPLIESCRRSSTPGLGPRIPFSFWAGRAFSGIYSCGQQFSCGVIDIVESMSRRVILTAVCAPPSVSFFLNFYDVTLPDFQLILCVDVYFLYDYSYISASPLCCRFTSYSFLVSR